MKTLNQKLFVETELKWLKHWEKTDVFKKTLRGEKTYVFYDGPPFATGLPHYGHLLASVVKDVVPRYFAMNGFLVERQFGWDCHGVPVENEVQNQLGLFSNKQVVDYGVDKFNETCRSVVTRYTQEWKETVHRVGRWVDMEKPYHTMDFDFMNSVWWVWKTLYDKNLTYQDYKVVPYSVGLGSGLSNFEAGQNYKTVQDLSLTVEFETDNGYTLLAWTTTPWTLPMNVGLAVNPELNYVVVEQNNKQYVVAENQLTNQFVAGTSVKQTLKGTDLVGLTYKPLFGFSCKNPEVVAGSFVTDSSGTGVVHLAPCYGEEDFSCAKANDLPLFHGVNDEGKYYPGFGELSGKLAFDSNNLVAELLGDKVYKQQVYEHEYPFCYRTDTRLMYRAVNSWYVKVEQNRGQLLKNNKLTNWNPESLRDGRFGNWLENCRDWSVSRSRFWGTPLPVWLNKQGEEVCFGSAKELEEATGVVLTDLHSHFLKDVVVKSKQGGDDLVWCGFVFDCWFESGAMPYAKVGFPWKTQTLNTPADFVAEGLDQTRGWFYTLSVLSTLLFDQPPFKNVSVNGLVLAEDGKKMSKKLKNYPDPSEVLEAYGADALRLYFMSKPVVCGTEMKFSKKEVEEQVKKNVLRLYNAYHLFVTYANLHDLKPTGTVQPTKFLNKYLVELTNNLTFNLSQAVESYHLEKVTGFVTEYVENLVNNHVRLAKPLLKQGDVETLNVGYQCLLQLAVSLAPFTPFMAEEFYQSLEGPLESVHLESYPKPENLSSVYEKQMVRLVEVLELGRNYREKHKLSLKLPLKTMVVYENSLDVLDELKELEECLKQELNFEQVLFSSDVESVFDFKVKPNFSLLGRKLGPEMKSFVVYLATLDTQTTLNLVKTRTGLQFKGVEVTFDELVVEKLSKLPDVLTTPKYCLRFDLTVDEKQLEQERERELFREVQELRKQLKLTPGDKVVLCSTEVPSESLRNKLMTEAFVVGFNTGSETMMLQPVP